MARAWIIVAQVCLGVLLIGTTAASANINLEWRPLAQTVDIGDPVGVGLYAVSDNSQQQGFSSVQVIMDWNPTYLLCTGNSTEGAVDLYGSSFIPGDSFGINESNPPTDGDGIWFGMVSFGEERFATPAGALLTTITFTALAPTPDTPLTMLADSSGHPHPPHPTGYTKMLNLGSQSVLGALGGSATVTILPEPATLGLLGLAGLLLPRWRKRTPGSAFGGVEPAANRQ
jgi:hypothetical protein